MNIFKNNKKDFFKINKIVFMSVVLSWLVVMVSCSPVEPGEQGTVVVLQEVSKLLASDGTANVHFAMRMAIDGDTAIIGRPDVNISGNGAAYIFIRNGTTWTEQAKLIASDGADNDWFGYSVAIANDVAFVGAPNDDDSTNNQAPNRGAVYVFTRSGTNWTEQQKVSPVTPYHSSLGGSLAMDGDTLVVGDGFKYNIFIFDGVNLIQQATIGAPGGTTYPEQAISIKGDTLIIGHTPSRRAYVFTRSGTNWSQQAELKAFDELRTFFGESVAIDGDTAIVGAYQDLKSAGIVSGASYIFTRSGTVWTEQAKLVPSDGASGDWFGHSVAIIDDVAIVGAIGEDDDIRRDNTGSIYVFIRNGNTWSEQQKISASDTTGGDLFGSPIAVDGDRVIVGSEGDDDNGQNSGSAYIFQMDK